MHKIALTLAAALAIAACSGESASDDSYDMPMDGSHMDTDSDGRANMGAPMMGEGNVGHAAMMRGEWFDREMAGHHAAMFGPPNSEASFSVRCEGDQLVFSRSVLIESGDTVDMHLMAGGETRTMAAEAITDPLPRVTGSLAADDPFADLLAQTEEPIAVSIADGASAGMPASAVLRDVVGNCGT